MALAGWQIESAANARRQMEQASKRRMELVNPPPPELPGEAVSGMQRLAESYNVAYGQARQANEARYQQMLGIADAETRRRMGLQERQLGVLDRTTGQRAADIRAEGISREADVMQRLGRTGLAGTSGATTERAGVRRGTQESLSRLADLMGERRIGVLGQMAQPMQGAKLGIMERRADPYPDPTAMTGAFGAVGEGYGGSGITAMMNALSRMRQ